MLVFVNKKMLMPIHPVYFLRSLLFPYRGGMAWALSSLCKTDQADFMDRMSFLPSHFMEEIISNTETLSANT